MFGKTIKQNRNKQHLTQQQLAYYAGATRANIAKIESGAYLPSLYLTLKILQALEMDEHKTIRRLIYGHDRKQHVN